MLMEEDYFNRSIWRDSSFAQNHGVFSLISENSSKLEAACATYQWRHSICLWWGIDFGWSESVLWRSEDQSSDDVSQSNRVDFFQKPQVWSRVQLLVQVLLMCLAFTLWEEILVAKSPQNEVCVTGNIGGAVCANICKYQVGAVWAQANEKHERESAWAQLVKKWYLAVHCDLDRNFHIFSIWKSSVQTFFLKQIMRVVCSEHWYSPILLVTLKISQSCRKHTFTQFAAAEDAKLVERILLCQK